MAVLTEDRIDWRWFMSGL